MMSMTVNPMIKARAIRPVGGFPGFASTVASTPLVFAETLQFLRRKNRRMHTLRYNHAQGCAEKKPCSKNRKTFQMVFWDKTCICTYEG
jgi:hypothetical protein